MEHGTSGGKQVICGCENLFFCLFLYPPNNPTWVGLRLPTCGPPAEEHPCSNCFVSKCRFLALQMRMLAIRAWVFTPQITNKSLRSRTIFCLKQILYLFDLTRIPNKDSNACSSERTFRRINLVD